MSAEKREIGGQSRWMGTLDYGIARHSRLYGVAIEYISQHYNLGVYTFWHYKDKEGTATKYDYEVDLATPIEAIEE